MKVTFLNRTAVVGFGLADGPLLGMGEWDVRTMLDMRIASPTYILRERFQQECLSVTLAIFRAALTQIIYFLGRIRTTCRIALKKAGTRLADRRKDRLEGRSKVCPS
jgi:hypothetical protein